MRLHSGLFLVVFAMACAPEPAPKPSEASSGDVATAPESQEGAESSFELEGASEDADGDADGDADVDPESGSDSDMGGEPDEGPDDEEGGDKARGPVKYSYSFFHLIFALAAMYTSMLLTGWGARRRDDAEAVGNDWTSVWVKFSSAWVAGALYPWCLIAPALFPDREF